MPYVFADSFPTVCMRRSHDGPISTVGQKGREKASLARNRFTFLPPTLAKLCNGHKNWNGKSIFEICGARLSDLRCSTSDINCSEIQSSICLSRHFFLLFPKQMIFCYLRNPGYKDPLDFGWMACLFLRC